LHSEKLEQDKMELNLELFLTAMRKKVKSMSKKEFKELVDDMLKNLISQPHGFKEVNDRLWREIVNETHVFKRRQEKKEHLDGALREDF